MIQTARLAALAGLEALINKALTYDPVAQQQLARFDDQIIAVKVTVPRVSVWVRLQGGSVGLLSQWDDAVDASIAGQGKDFLALVKETDKQQVLMSSRMEVSGNTQLLTGLQNLAAQLDIDWEAAVADVFGDLAGHWIAKALRFGGQLARDTANSFDRSWQNYWRYETDSLVSSQQFQSRASDIAKTRFEADRLEARIARLQQRMADPR